MWLLNETPSSIHRKLNLPDQDQGIDLICETNDGEYWAVQAKYHEDETTSQTWRSLSTFTGLAFGVCKNISFGLVCTTSERYTKTLKNQDNIGFCTGEIWRGLDEDFFTSLTRKRKPKKLKAYKPFNHQKRAIKEAHKHYVTNNESRGKMIMPCGTGKSLTAFWIAERLDAKRILVAVPSLSLIRQTLQVWLRETYAKGWDVDWITVCSDKTVSKMEKDDLAVLTQDLGIPAVTDPKVIASWLRKRHSGRVVVFTTYQSGKAIAEATRLARRNFDLGIMDEAHKTVGKKDKTFAHLLFDENIKISKRVFMTATERRYTGIQDTIVSMDDYDVYGETFEFLSFKDALDEDPPILSDYKIVTVMVGNDEIAELVKTGKFVKPSRGKWDDEIQADTFASLVALRKAVKKYRIKHALSFHSSIARAEAYQENQNVFTELFTDYQKMDTFFVSGKMPTSVRDRHLRDFEQSKRALISNARCLTEGVDVPDIDCVLFADPKKSTIDIVQAVGRALRKSEGKKFGYVIVPVVIEKEGQGFEESQAFESILMTLRALASNDERIIDYFRDRANGKRTKRKVIIDIPEQLAEKIDENKFVRELELKAWNKLAKLSWMPFEEAREFVNSLNLKKKEEWNRYCKGEFDHLPFKPFDIPNAPNAVYKNAGWIGYGDWLGTGFIAPSKRNYLDFKDARKLVRSLELKNNNDWIGYCRGELKHLDPKPASIPTKAERVYKNDGWINLGDWLGTGTIHPTQRVYRSYIEAKEFVHKLKLKSVGDWGKYCKGEFEDLPKMPKDIPAGANSVYKDKGWITWEDFLGQSLSRKKSYRSFESSREFVWELGLRSTREWRMYYQGKLKDLPPIPSDIPATPDGIYKNEGWSNWKDFLGYDFFSYEETSELAKKAGIKTWADYKKWSKNKIFNGVKWSKRMVVVPYKKYENAGWKGWNDFLDSEELHTLAKSKYFKSYKEARKFAICNRIGSMSAWRRLIRDKNISYFPVDVVKVYKNKGWIDVYHFLGKKKQEEWRNFEDARIFVQNLNLKTQNEWREYTKSGKKPIDIPANPNQVYKNDGWKSLGDWLGTGNIANKKKVFILFDEAKRLMRMYKVRSAVDYRSFLKSSQSKKFNLPSTPNRHYKTSWKGWGDFLGTRNIGKGNWISFVEARKFTRALGLNSFTDWRNFASSYKRPQNIPAKPNVIYKNKGWISFSDFLGYEPKRKNNIPKKKVK